MSVTDVPGERKPVVVKDLRVDLGDTGIDIVKDVSFELHPGEILGLIGESGCGKTTVASALLGYARGGAKIVRGSVSIDGTDLLKLTDAELRSFRGGVVSYVPQDPTASLNPAIRIGKQLEEMLAQHGMKDKPARAERVAQMLAEVKLPSDKPFLRRYPHELSGGQQQRIVIAMAFLCRPRVVVLDEPTTGLDVTTQAYVLKMVRELCESQQSAGVYVSHDLAVVADLADRIAVMYYGRLVELGPAADIRSDPQHPYSRGLIQVIPDAKQRRALRTIRGRVAPISERPSGCTFADRCDFVEDACRTREIEMSDGGPGHIVRCRRSEFVRTLSVDESEMLEFARGTEKLARGNGYLSIQDLTAAYQGNEVLHGIDLEIPRSSVMALVGESGSGKTTLARCLGGLHDEATGTIEVDGSRLPYGSRRRSEQERRSVQYIFQNAYSALNPRKTVAESIAQPLQALEGCKPREARDRALELLEHVSLSPRAADTYPSQLSGGERQRVTIARALATTPSVLVCDEITSALDVSVQASILLLIGRLASESRMTLVFVTHNMAVVRAIADRVAVMSEGRIVEEGTVGQVLDSPSDPYTQRLLRDTPTLVTA
jgi:peptide/nickel transport system ATP-binding protein